MTEQMNTGNEGPVRTFERGKEVLDRMLAIARTETVYSLPVREGNYTLIQTTEAVGAVGFGFGSGSGEGEMPPERGASSAGQAMGETEEGEREGRFAGGGGGGGGYSYARPVAVIQLGPDGVRMQPIVDVTKIGIAMLTTLGTMFVMLGRMRRG